MSLQICHIKNPILKEISFSVLPGQCLVVFGPSGSGKTTLLRTIAGLEALEQGQIILGEKEITFLEPYQRNIAMLFQNHALFPHLNVLQNIEFPLKRKGYPAKKIRSKAEYFLDLMQMSLLAKRYPSSLSGGEKQRVALAQIFMLEPAALLLDEPLSHLDSANQEILLKEIKKIHKEQNFPLVYVTHDASEAQIMADSFLSLKSGAVVD